MKLFTKSEFKEMPWKNGGGTTLELFTFTEPSTDHYQLRISVATVAQDGPFSFFPGFRRTLLILNGEGCLLNSKELSSHSDPYVFDGEEAISCFLRKGPFQDFNVMIKKDWGDAIVNRVPNGSELLCDSDFLFIYDHQIAELRELHRGETFTTKNNAIIVKIKKRPA